ncbi:MAG TPA: glycosyltransferase, partial [Bryobacteraceae bacterium]|nr:glycosyltransferase [Bryobacteraceae bacterium]
CGTAVVTTKYGTEDYAIDGHTAIVVRPRVLTDFVLALDALVRNPELRARLAKNGRAMAESLTWEAAVAAREELLWRIHQNQMPNGGFHGFDTAILDGHGRRFEHVVAEFAAANGELLSGADGKQYVVEADRLRRVADLAALGMEVNGARPVDLLTLLRSEQGVEITSAANYYGGGAR